MNFSENLRDVLDFRGMHIKELSAKTGISKNTIDNYLSGQKSLPNVENGVKIAKILEVSVEYLVTGKDSNFDSSQIIQAQRQNSHQDEDFSDLFNDLKRLKKSDFDSIRTIIKSLARKQL